MKRTISQYKVLVWTIFYYAIQLCACGSYQEQVERKESALTYSQSRLYDYEKFLTSKDQSNLKGQFSQEIWYLSSLPKINSNIETRTEMERGSPINGKPTCSRHGQEKEVFTTRPHLEKLHFLIKLIKKSER